MKDYKVFVTCENCGKENKQLVSKLNYTEDYYSNAYFICSNCGEFVEWTKGDINFWDVINKVPKMESLNEEEWKEPPFLLQASLLFMIALLVGTFAMVVVPIVVSSLSQTPDWYIPFLMGALFIYALGKMRIIRVR